MIRIAATADWHLGAGTEYGRTPGDRLADQARVLNDLADQAIANDVSAVIHSGDLFHRRHPAPAEILVAQQILGLLRAAGVEVLIVGGNHDHPGIGQTSALDLFAGLVDVRREPDIWRGPGFTVGGLPWTPVSQLRALTGGGEIDTSHQQAVPLLLQIAQELRDSIDSGPALLALHYSVSGATTSTGALTDGFREIVLPQDALAEMGWDATLCGHIHRFQEVIPGRPFIYSGSPMVIDFGESLHDHGFVLLEVAA